MAFWENIAQHEVGRIWARLRKPRSLRSGTEDLGTINSLSPNRQTELLVPDVLINEQVLRGVFQNCSDVVYRPVLVNGQAKLLLVYIDGLVDTTVVDQVVLKPMMFEGMPDGLEKVGSFGGVVKEQLVAIAQVQTAIKVSQIVEGILKANVAVFTDGESQGLLADLKGFEKRSLEEPGAEIAIRGPRDGFTETLRVNTALVRRRIRSPKLKMESLTIGDLSQTDVVLAYIEGVAPDSVLNEVRQRVGRIQLDAVLESGFIEEFIEDKPFFPSRPCRIPNDLM